MKAMVMVERGRLQIQEIPTPQPGDEQVLVKTLGCGVCGTDVHIYHGQVTEGVSMPVVLGHEICGVVEVTGKRVKNVKEGQHVVINPLIGCGQCRHCAQGQPHLCPSPDLVGYKHNGGYAGYVLAPADNVHRIDAAVGVAGGILAETLACVVHGYDRLEFRAGSSAMILGAGTVGLLWNCLLRNSLCRYLVQSEPVAFRRRRAEELGADLLVDPENQDVEQVVRQALPDGVDFIVDASGEPQAVQQALSLLAKNGTFMVFGVCPIGSTVTFDPHELYQKEAKIVASKMPPLTLQRAIDLLEAGKIATDKIVTDVLPLEKLPEAIDGFQSNRGRQIKAVIDPWR